MSRDKFYTVPDIPVSDLLLDTNNPRIRHGEDQNDCIARILRDKDNFLRLVKDIAAEGLSPEHVLVSKNRNGKWVVRDGNRRITALKLLAQPELCQADPQLAPIIGRLARSANGSVPAAVTCLACDDENTILALLERKHTGENAGVGQRNWTALLKSLFNLQLGVSDPNKRAAQLVLWVEEHGLPVDDEFPITNLSRALNTQTLGLIGFGVLNDQLIPTLSVAQAYALASRVVLDTATGQVHVRRDDSEGSIYSPAQQLAYFRKVRAEVGPPLDDAAEAGGAAAQRTEDGSSRARSNSDGAAGGGHPTGSAAPTDAPPPTGSGNAGGNAGVGAPDRRPPSPSTPSWERPCLFVRKHPGFSIPAGHTKVGNIITELKNLQVKVTPQAVAMVFRTLVELSEAHYRTRHAIREADSFAKRIARAADHMLAAGLLTQGQHEVVISRSREEGGILHAVTLHKYVHSPDFHPNYQTINSLWDEIGCFVAACWR